MSEKKKTNMTEAELFSFIDRDAIASEKITAPRYSYWKSVFRVFFRKKTNIIMLVLLFLIIFGSFVMPIFWPYDPMENVLDAKTYNLSPSAAVAYFRDNPAYEANPVKWCLGTGNLGNSIMYGIMSSARTSLLLAIICAAINMTVGIIVVAVWGYSKKVDAVMLVIYNIIANVPYILLISVLVYIIGSGFWPFVFALTVTGWLGIAYFFRTQVMIIRDRVAGHRLLLPHPGAHHPRPGIFPGLPLPGHPCAPGDHQEYPALPDQRHRDPAGHRASQLHLL